MKDIKIVVEDLFDGHTISTGRCGPKYLILVCIHGNETCGLEAILSLSESGELGELLTSGELTVLLGNKEAYLRNQRIINRDLNRSIGRVDLNNDYERDRAVLVETFIKSADFVLDIHSTSSPSPSHAIPCENKDSEHLAQKLCTNYMVTKIAHLTVEGGTTMDFAKTQNTCAVTVECGQHDEVSAVDTAINCIRKFLQGCEEQCKDQLECKGSIEVKEGFSFNKPYSGFDFIKYNEKVAQDSSGDIVCPFPQGAFIVMPNRNPVVGEEAFYWAVRLECE